MFPTPLNQVHLPAAVPAAVEVWQLDLPLDESLDYRTLSVLTDAERTRCFAYHRPHDQVRFAITRATLRRLLAERLATSPELILFDAGKYGKPVLSGAPYFNVSHSGNYALIAMSDLLPVGVDLEQWDESRPVKDLAELVLTECERAHCAEGKNVAAFFDLWTAKEAVLKAWGWGIGKHLQALSIGPRHDREYALALNGVSVGATQAWQLSAPPGYAATLAVGYPDGPSQIDNVSEFG